MMTALGVLGLIPFVAAPLRLMDGFGPGLAWTSLQAIYAAVILAFLGGVRAAHAAFAVESDTRVIVAAMAPPLVGFGLGAAATFNPARTDITAGALLGLALALAVQGAWDVNARTLPDWYRRLRIPLTVVACLALASGALLAGILA
ncbi:DUF3429 domain-containing protein [Caulobacter sp. FWC2]|uniref:DUF3429 domain-containing protein n=1 Tax=Caulobacter sp. FWC2 TaxID=69664 RepID=UPI000C15BC81|nr:DUF3429 domain-containing protein [Caulobacter sp. FWC2]PIB90819.1 DUF3429 domain-containing protein [Caulobacter sp. FWC2]